MNERPDSRPVRAILANQLVEQSRQLREHSRALREESRRLRARFLEVCERAGLSAHRPGQGQ